MNDDTDYTIKNGYFEESSISLDIICKGYYVNGLKEGVWLHYYTVTKEKYIGSYIKGEKTGYFEYFINDTLDNVEYHII